MNTPEQFLSAMRDRYGISEDFVSAGRPFVGAIYAEFDGKQRADLLDFAESVFAQQAATERAIRSSSRSLREAAGRLERAIGDFHRGLEALRRAATERPRPLPSRPVVTRWQLN